MEIGATNNYDLLSHSNLERTNNTPAEQQTRLSNEKVTELKEQIDSFGQEVLASTLEDFRAQFLEIPTQDSLSLSSNEAFSIKNVEELNFEETSGFDIDGFFGIKQTSQRIADFVIDGANGNIDLLRAGKSGVTQGFEEAKQILGDDFADISEQTFNKAIDLINEQITTLGFNLLDIKA